MKTPAEVQLVQSPAEPALAASAPRPPDALPRIETIADVLRHEGRRAEIHGVYRVTPPEEASKTHPVWIGLADGTSLLRSYEPIAEEFHLRDKPVVIIGVVRMSSLLGPNGIVSAGIDAPQVTVERIVPR